MVSNSSSAVDPSEELPRDPTGSYLHLKLKRFPSIEDLTMPYAKKTWQQMPHDASVAMAPNGHAVCRQCHNKVDKGALRFQLALQCHKGCKNSAFFHADCVWQYPETKKITQVEEFVGMDDLPSSEKKLVVEQIETFIASQKGDDKGTKDKTKQKRKKKSAKDPTNSVATKKAKRRT